MQSSYFAAIYKLYNKAWEYASIGELKQIFKAITLSIIVTAIVQQIINHDIYVRILAIAWMLHLLLIGGSRFVWRMFRDTYIVKATDKKNINYWCRFSRNNGSASITT